MLDDPTITLGWGRVLASCMLVLVAGVVSIALRLQLERRLAWGAVRAIVQLMLVGYILQWVFDAQHAAVLLPVILVMSLFASHAAIQRVSRRYRRAAIDAFVILTLSGLLTTFTVTHVIIGVTPWHNPRYVIPLLGMVFGNGLTGVSLCMDLLLETLSERRADIEMRLAHGATSWEAARPHVAESVRRGMIPTINSMMVVGVVLLPGMMTGQILAGNPPMQAVQYQIVVMFMIAAGTALGCIGMALLTYRRVFNRQHQLRHERIQSRER